MPTVLQLFLLSILLAPYTSCQSNPTPVKPLPVEIVDTLKSPLDQILYPVPLSPIDTSENYLMGHFDPMNHSEFTPIEEKYADRSGLWLRKDVYAAFQQMYEAALQAGIALQIRSATRNFTYQKGIWERKWTGQTALSNGEKLHLTTPNPVDRALKILRYSSMPGTSRHHWGTDIDLNNFNNAYFEQGEGKKIYDWLHANAAKYGFFQPYTALGTDRNTGYQEEKWHWSYAPIALPLTKAAYKLQESSITGFLGAETAEEIQVVKNYILGINPVLLPKQ